MAEVIGALFLLVIMFGFYFLPTILAAMQDKKQTLAIFLLNFLAGWTVIGWIIALVWGAMKD